MIEKRILLFFLSALYTAIPGLSNADDTEIYLGPEAGRAGTAPNVLFVLDTSGSMSNTDLTGKTRLQRMKDALHIILDSSQNINVGLMRFHGEGGPVLYPLSHIDAIASTVEGTNPSDASTIRSQISQSSDDAEEYLSDNTVILDSDELELIHSVVATASSSVNYQSVISSSSNDLEESNNGWYDEGSSDLELVDEGGSHSSRQTIGLRFTSVNIPVGATILSAAIDFTIDENGSGDPDLTIVGHKVSHSLAFSTSVRQNVSNRLTSATAASVSWKNIATPAIGTTLSTPDLASIVSELTSTANGWSSGNAMTFIIQDSGNGNEGKRVVESRDSGSSTAPHLRITYSTSAQEEDQAIGLRFKNIAIPQGATITSATIEFEAARSNNETANITIDGEGHDDAPTFAQSSNNITDRSLTSGQVSWDIPAWSEGDRYQSPDLKSIVQNIVDRSGWCGGNAMAFVIKGVADAVRIAKSYEENAAAAPILNIEYDQDSVSDTACVNQVLMAQVTSDRDDAEEASDGSMDLYSSDLELVEDGDDQTVGIRFRNIYIPKDTTITEAWLEFITDDDDIDSGATSLTIRGELSGNSAEFTSSDEDISTRTTTSQSTSWNPGAWNTSGESHDSPDIASVVQEIVNQSGWAAGNSMSFIVTGSGERTAESHDGSEGEAPVLHIKIQGKLADASEQTVRSRLHHVVDDLQHKGGTPIVDTLYEAGQYYRGQSVVFGTTRGNSIGGGSLYESERTRVSHPASYTGGTVIRDSGCTDANLNATACQTERIDGSPMYISPIGDSTCQGHNIILLSDGFPSRNVSVDLIEDLIGESCSGSGSGKCGNELASHLYSPPSEDTKPVKTYTIGFNLDDDDGKAYLENLATNGGGSFHEASSSAALVSVFDDIITDVLDQPTSFVAPSISINAFNRLYNLNEIYLSLFEPHSTKRWQGNVKKYKVCDGTIDDEDITCAVGDILDAANNQTFDDSGNIASTARSLWSASVDGSVIAAGGAGSQIPSYSSRRIYTYTTSTDPDNANLSLSAHSVSNDNTALTKAMLGDENMTNSYRTKLIQWIQGKDIMDEDEDQNTNENRWSFHDPIHSGAVPITYGKQVSGETTTPVTKIFVATNDGMLRMINAHNGQEEWAFLPQKLLAIQNDLMTDAEGDHIYGLDSTPVVDRHDVNHDGIINPSDGDYVHLYVGMRRGGRNIYALDVTPSATLSNPSGTTGITPKLLWRIQGGSGDFAKLGETWSAPQLASISYPNSGGTALTNKSVLIFAGGYEHTSQDSLTVPNRGFQPAAYGNALFIVDSSDGSLLWRASPDETTASTRLDLDPMTYAIPSDLALMDSDSDGHIDRFYVGDLGGQLWRIDLWKREKVDGTWGIANPSGARLANISSNTADADKRKFFYPPDIAQLSDSVFSNTELYDLITIGTGNRSHPLDKTVHNRFYAFRDPHINSRIPSDYTALTEDNLYDATDNLIQEGTSGDEGTKKAALDSLKTKKGWYLELKEYSGSSLIDDSNHWIGEKVLASPLILDGKLFFTTYIPQISSNPCAVIAGISRLYVVNLLNAAAVFDFSNDSNHTKVDRNFVVGDGIASLATIILPPKTGDGGDGDGDGDTDDAGIRVLVGTGDDIKTFNPDVDLSKTRTFWRQDFGN